MMAIRVADERVEDEVASELLFGNLCKAPYPELGFQDAEDVLQGMIRLSM